MRVGLAPAGVLLLALLVPAPASAAVQFVDEQPPSIGLATGTRLSLSLFNGSSRTQKLALRVLGEQTGELDVRPPEPVLTAPGELRTFSVVLTRPPRRGADRTLLATSSDGTTARIKLRLGAPAAEPPSLPTSLDLGVGLVGKTREVTVSGLPRVTKAALVGRLYTTGGSSLAVTLFADRALKLARPTTNGTYSGNIDVNGSADGGVVELTTKAKDGPILAFLVLALGVGVGFLVEWWLTRWRPQSLLDRRLGRLVADAEARRGRLDNAMRSRFLESRPEGFQLGDSQPWAVPQIATAEANQVSRYYLSRAGRELELRLCNATTDPERALFGPDGDRLKGLLVDARTYAALVGDLREAAAIVERDFRELRDQGPIALRSAFDFECRSWVVGDEEDLAARRDTARALKTAAGKFAEYRRRLDRAITQTDDASLLRGSLEAHKRLLETSFRGGGGQDVWWDEVLPKLESQLEARVSAPVDSEPADEPTLALSDSPADIGKRPTLGGTANQEFVDPVPPWEASGSVLRSGALGRMEKAIGAISVAIVIVAGFASGYLANDTFGSLPDYLALALWGSTATAGLALLRRLFPGALTTVQPGVGS